MKKFKQTIKKYSFWTGLSGAVVLLVNAIAKCFGFEIDNKLIEDIIMSVCGVLVALGIVCVPIKTEEQEPEEQTTEETDEQTQDEQKDTQDDKDIQDNK